MINESIITIGKLVATHGIKGWIAIESYSHPADNIKNYKTFIKINNESVSIDILQLKVLPKKIIVQLKGYDDINVSEKIVGHEILIYASEIPALKTGEYYWKDIEGLEVYSTENIYVGQVDFMFNNGANDVLAIKKKNTYLYIPYIHKYIKVVPSKKILVDHEII